MTKDQHQPLLPTLKPCPFCNAGETLVDEQKYWTGMSSEIISVTVRHWCPKSPLSSIIELKAKTREEAIALWNRRSPPELPPPDHEKDLLTVGGASSQTQCAGSRSSPAPVPLTTEEKP